MLLITDRPPAPPERIAAIERAYGAALPTAFRAFLLRHDGGEADCATLELAGGRSTTVSRFYSTQEGESYSLFEGLDFHDEFFPQHFRPIAETGDGDKFLIATGGTWRGKVFFYYHDRPSPKAIPEAADVELIADDFTAFEHRLCG